jgi:hypothetical protein
MSAPGSDYHETLQAPPSWWALGGCFVLAVWWAFFVSTPQLVMVTATVIAILVVGGGLAMYGGVDVIVDGRTLRAGAAHLPLAYVGTVEQLDADQVRRQMGVDADARAFVLYRAYVPTAVKVEVNDDRDPTPYWLISTRDPATLAAHLGGASVQD